MAKQKFAIGAELDILGSEDLGAALAWWRKQSQRPEVSYTSATFTVNANGALTPTNGDSIVLQVDAGQKAEILRAQVWDTTLTYTPAAPLQTGWIGLFRNSMSQPPLFFFPGSGSTVLPAVWTNTDDCPRLYGSDRLIAQGYGLGSANSAQVTVSLMYRLWLLPGARASLVTPSAN